MKGPKPPVVTLPPGPTATDRPTANPPPNPPPCGPMAPPVTTGLHCTRLVVMANRQQVAATRRICFWVTEKQKVQGLLCEFFSVSYHWNFHYLGWTEQTVFLLTLVECSRRTETTQISRGHSKTPRKLDAGSCTLQEVSSFDLTPKAKRIYLPVCSFHTRVQQQQQEIVNWPAVFKDFLTWLDAISCQTKRKHSRKIKFCNILFRLFFCWKNEGNTKNRMNTKKWNIIQFDKFTI